MRPKRLAKGNGELLIVGHLTKIVIAGFFITDPETKLQLNTPHFVLGKLPLRPGKVLNIVVWKEPDNGLKTMLRASLKRVPIPLADTDDASFRAYCHQLPGDPCTTLRLHGGRACVGDQLKQPRRVATGRPQIVADTVSKPPRVFRRQF